MASFETRRLSGYDIGIVLQDYRGPFVPGDVGNATSYSFPVAYLTVPGTKSARMFVGDPELTPDIVRVAKELAAQGVRGLSSDCGFFARYQDAVTAAVNIPVFLSSMLQLPLVLATLGAHRSVAIITANGPRLDRGMIEASGTTEHERIIVRGLQKERVFGGSVTGGSAGIDTDELGSEMVHVARQLVHEAPQIGAFLIECSMLPPYSRLILEATGLPVFDFQTMIRFFHSVLFRERTPQERRYKEWL